MVKKVIKYIGLVLGALTCLPMFVATWNYAISVNGEKSDPITYKLFDKVGTIEKTALGDHFSQFWLTLFQILVVVALVVAVLLIVVSVLDDLGVLKLQKVEKLLALVLAVVGLVALITVVIASIVNKNTIEVLTVKTVYGISGAVGAWLASVFAVVGGALVYCGVEAKKKSKKKK